MSNAIQFLASVAERPNYKSLFEDPNTLASICEKVIVPNMEFRSKFACFQTLDIFIQDIAIKHFDVDVDLRQLTVLNILPKY